MSSYRETTIGESDPEMEFSQPTEAPPPPAIGALSNYVIRDTGQSDDGPYYLFSPGETVSTIEDWVGFPRLQPAEVAIVNSPKYWVNKLYIDNPTGLQRETLDPLTRRPDGHVEAQYAIPANHNRDSLLEKYGRHGPSDAAIIEVTSFAKHPNINLAAFNRRIVPLHFARKGEHGPHTQEPELRSEIEHLGALAVRERLAREATLYYAGSEFIRQRGKAAGDMMKRACEEIIAAYAGYRLFARAYMDKQDQAIQLPPDNAKSKDDYDDRDRDMQWLLARPGVDPASILSRTVDKKATPVEVKINPGDFRTPTPPQIQCDNCGAFANLLAGGKPPKMCGSCREPFPEETPKPSKKQNGER